MDIYGLVAVILAYFGRQGSQSRLESIVESRVPSIVKAVLASASQVGGDQSS